MRREQIGEDVPWQKGRAAEHPRRRVGESGNDQFACTTENGNPSTLEIRGEQQPRLAEAHIKTDLRNETTAAALIKFSLKI
jgi:hypothetical protein